MKGICSVKSCGKANVVAVRKRLISNRTQPTTSNSAQKSQTEFYFCANHFDSIELCEKIHFVSPEKIHFVSSEICEANNPSHKQMPSFYSNRKRRSTPKQISANSTKLGKNDPPYTLDEEANSRDDTKVNVIFSFPECDSEWDEYVVIDRTEPEIEPEKIESTNSLEDNDCIILAEQLPTVIDLSDDNPESQEDSNKMIELIWCNEAEGDLPEMTNETYNQQELLQFLRERTPSIDLTRDNLEVDDGNMKLTVDLTDDQVPHDTNRSLGVSDEGIQRISERLNERFPGAVKSITCDVESKRFEISTKKSRLAEAENIFHEYIQEVINEEFQLKCAPQEPAKTYNENVDKIILNKEYRRDKQTAKMSQKAETESLQPTKETSNKSKVVDNNSVSNILKKSDLYLGITTKTFHRIENLLNGRFRNRSFLILVLRKIKLNESFHILSDQMCPKKKGECIIIFHEFVSNLWSKLRGFVRWPTNGQREPKALLDIFEIEIEKPKSLIEQSISFCSHTQRYTVKFLVCCTSNGYVTHVSLPFHAIEAKILESCLTSIPNCAAAIVNPILINLSQQFMEPQRIVSLFDSKRQMERKIVHSLFDRIRQFSFVNSISDLSNVSQLQQTLSLVACMCNLEME
ncbi:hypothetical protein Bhyg_04098 [Pseudolycoriella hygida]|uniref:DDE Tnp4 domain-containing protein n=1 Tax=Pseudolycoriella hygida TaxID=35572 RepID=A0A9Q0NEK3_9DIPT|nr:hypothetical protein Bhyg_04098 [Pseudolycoriella hygida]